MPNFENKQEGREALDTSVSLQSAVPKKTRQRKYILQFPKFETSVLTTLPESPPDFPRLLLNRCEFNLKV